MQPRPVVSVWCFVADPLQVLVLKRPPERAAGWQPVTGRVEDGETLHAACIREVHEEAALPPPLELLDLGLEHDLTGYDGVRYRQHAYAARYAHAQPPQVSHEHEEARWVGVDDARGLLRWDQDRLFLDALLARLRPG